MDHCLGWVSGSDWGLEKVTGTTDVEDVMRQQQQLRRKRKGEREANPVIPDIQVLRMLPVDQEVLESHISPLGKEGRRRETNPTGQE